VEILLEHEKSTSVTCAGSANKNTVNTDGMEKDTKSLVYFQDCSAGCNWPEIYFFFFAGLANISLKI